MAPTPRFTISLVVALAALVGCSDDAQQAEPSGDAGSDDILDEMDLGDGDGDAADPDTADTAVEPADPADLESYCGPDFADVEARIGQAIAAMTLEQKVSLMHGVFALPIDGTWSTEGIEDLDIPGFDMLDGPRGLSRFSEVSGTAFPVAMARGATWDPDLEQEVGQAIGAELREFGADTLLAPTVNILRHPRWGRAQETYGEDPLHMGVMGTQFVLGAQAHVMAVVKHYAANSIEDTRLEVNVNVSERTLREIYLPHFKMIVQGGQVAGVMSSYNQINGLWGSEQTHLLGDVLREEWAFAGFVVSDFTWGTHDTVAALEAGLDVEMQFANVYGRRLVTAVGAGDVDESLVDLAVRRIVRAQWCFRERTVAPDIDELEAPETLALARRVAVRAMVLLENGEDALPIDRTSAPTIAVIGSLAAESNTGDRGSSHVRSSRVVTMLEGLEAAAGDATIVHVPGDLSAPADRDTITAADVVVAVVGYSEDEEGEGQIAAGDRESLALPADDVAVLDEATGLNDRVIAVVVGGSSFTTDGWGDEVEALVMSWYAGAEGGNALGELLYGESNFSGRLPISFAARDEDHPPFDNVSTEVDYGYFHGYRHLQNEDVAALYPFGFGLGYSEFDYDDLAVTRDGDSISVAVDVSNTGTVDGIETVQVYVQSPGAAVERAPRDLRGFVQVTVAAGATERVEIEIPVDSLRYFDEDADSWSLEPGEYVVEVGPNVRDLDVSEALTLP